VKQADQVIASQHARESCSASLFGRFRIHAPNGSEIAIANRRARALLAMLCLARGEAFDRDFLSKLLWAGRFEAHARASLRQCLLDLGKLLAPYGTEMLDVTRTSVSLRPGAMLTDLGALEDMLARGDHAAAAVQLAAIGTRPILDQMDLGDGFNQWLSRYRSDAEARLRSAIEDSLAELLRAGNEAAHAQLFLASSLRCLVVSPSAAEASPAGTARLAVLPFQPLGQNQGHDYFADGMVDELITALGQVPQLVVSGRTSSFHFRGSDLSPSQIAAELGVSHLIEGSVQRQGDRVRIHAHLIAGATGVELWGARFDGSLDDVFAFQEQVAQAITAAIGAALGIDMEPPRVRGMTRSKEAYDLYLQGRSLCARVMGDGVLDKGIGLLEQALEIDPGFAEAWVVLAEAHQMVAVYTQCSDRPAAIARMAECARQALALVPDLGYPRALLGIERWIAGDIVGALDLAFEAYRLEPKNPAIPMRLGSMLAYIGRTEQATPYIEAAVDQDPIDPRKYALVWAVHMARNDLAAARDAGQRMVDLAFPSLYLACSTAALGHHDLAVEQYQLTKQLVNTVVKPPAGSEAMSSEAMDAYWLMAAKGVCSGREEDRQTYRQMLDFMYATLPDKGDLAIAAPAIFTGHAELAFKALGDSASPANMLAYIELWNPVEPMCHIWQHPEFIAFAQRSGMAAAWDKYGWPDLLPPPSNSLAQAN
jgi:TolB-like protein